MLNASLVLGCVLIIGFFAPGLRTVPKRLLRLIVVYGIIAILLRGIYLAAYNPRPTYNNPVPIASLFSAGYSASISRIFYLETIEYGVVISIFWLTTMIFNRWIALRSSRQASAPSTLPVSVRRAIVAAYGIGFLCRLATLHSGGAAAAVTVVAGSPVARLGGLCTASVVVLIFSRSWADRRNRAERWILGCLVGFELIYSFIASTKSPIVTVAVALYLAWPERSVNNGQIDFNKRYMPAKRSLISLFFVVIVSFSLINAIRSPSPDDFAIGTKPGALTVVKTELSNPGRFAIGTVVRVSARLDGLDAAADAMDNPPPGKYISWGPYFRSALYAPIPASVGADSKVSPGEEWAVHYEDVKFSVDLAQTPAAEGFAMAGTSGLVIWGAIFGFVFGLLSASIEVVRRTPKVVTIASATCICSAALIEQGLLNSWYTYVDGFEIAVVWYVLYLLAVDLSRKHMDELQNPRPPPSHYPHGAVSGRVHNSGLARQG